MTTAPRVYWTEWHTERCRELAGQGLSKKFVSRQLGCSVALLTTHARELGVRFTRMPMEVRRAKVGHLMVELGDSDERLAAAKLAWQREIRETKAAMVRDCPPPYRAWPEGT